MVSQLPGRLVIRAVTSEPCEPGSGPAGDAGSPTAGSVFLSCPGHGGSVLKAFSDVSSDGCFPGPWCRAVGLGRVVVWVWCALQMTPRSTAPSLHFFLDDIPRHLWHIHPIQHGPPWGAG